MKKGVAGGRYYRSTMGGSERLGWCFFILQEGMPECVHARSLQLHVVAEKLIAVCGQVDSACKGYVVVRRCCSRFGW